MLVRQVAPATFWSCSSAAYSLCQNLILEWWVTLTGTKSWCSGYCSECLMHVISFKILQLSSEKVILALTEGFLWNYQSFKCFVCLNSLIHSTNLRGSQLLFAENFSTRSYNGAKQGVLLWTFLVIWPFYCLFIYFVYLFFHSLIPSLIYCDAGD